MTSRRYAAIRHGSGPEKNPVFHREHRSKKGRDKYRGLKRLNKAELQRKARKIAKLERESFT